VIDEIIDKCWHNKYAKVSDLAADTKTLLGESEDEKETVLDPVTESEN
jgi:hypothetical protein